MDNDCNVYDFLVTLTKDLDRLDKKSIARDVLDTYWKESKTFSDLNTLGEAALKCGYNELHLKCAEKIYSSVIDFNQKRLARQNLYRAYNKMNYPEKALFYINLDLKEFPDDYELLLNKAVNLSLLGDKRTSDNMLLDLLERFPDKEEEIQNILASYYLRQGNVTAGVLHFGGNKIKYKDYFTDVLNMEHWEGQEASGRTVIVNAGGGYGDGFIFIRFFDYMKELGIKPVYYSKHGYFSDLARIFRRHGIETIHDQTFFPSGAMWTNFIEVSAYLGLSEDDLWRRPYIKAIRNNKNKLSPTTKLRIGFKCSGNPDFSQDIYRSIELEKMLEFFPDDVELYYIDKLKTNNSNVIDTSDMISSWDDTLDIIDQMDIIVSTCTSLAHAAGAMGKRTLVFTPIAEYFIWTSTRDIDSESTPWYGDHLTVLKQRQPRDWTYPLKRMNTIIKGIQHEFRNM